MGCELSLVRLAMMMAARLAEAALAKMSALAEVARHLKNGLFVMRTAVRRTALQLADALQSDPDLIARLQETPTAPVRRARAAIPKPSQPPRALTVFALDRARTPKSADAGAAPPRSAARPKRASLTDNPDFVQVQRLMLAAQIHELQALAIVSEATLARQITRMAHAILRLRLAPTAPRAPFDLVAQARDETRLDAILSQVEATANAAAGRASTASPTAAAQRAPMPHPRDADSS